MAKVKHIALIKFKEGTSQEQLDPLFESLLDLSETIDGIEDYVEGPNNSPENLNKGFTHGFVMSFSDAASRDAYLTHSEHVKFKDQILPFIEDIVVFDFEV